MHTDLHLGADGGLAGTKLMTQELGSQGRRGGFGHRTMIEHNLLARVAHLRLPDDAGAMTPASGR